MAEDTVAIPQGRGDRADDLRRAVEEGLGGSRYKEYEYPPYAEVVWVYVPQHMWSAVYMSWLSLKGHLQGLHDFDRTEFFCTRCTDGRILAIFVAIWQGADTLAEWLENGYSIDETLRGIGIPDADITVELMRDYS